MSDSDSVSVRNSDHLVVRTAAVASQVREALALRGRLVDHLNAVLPPPKKPSRKSNPAPKSSLLQTIILGAEGWTPNLKPVSAATLDRTSSILAGPFFTSDDYPIPGPEDGMWLPVIQLDLRQLTELTDLNLGDGLLQLWCDPDYDNGARDFIRIIPREDVSLAAMKSFDFVMPNFEVTPIDDEWVFDPDAEKFNVITDFESLGVQCQADYLDLYVQDLDEALIAPVAGELKRFKVLTAFEGGRLHLFGSFRPIQYSAADVDAYCLVSFPRWGSEGNAQLLVASEGQGLTYLFRESLR